MTLYAESNAVLRGLFEEAGARFIGSSVMRPRSSARG